MTRILSVIGDDLQVSTTYKAGAIIPFYVPVKLNAAGTVVTGTGADSIGWAVPLDAVEAANENGSPSSEQYNAGDLVCIKLKNEVLNIISGAAFAVGDFLKGSAAGKYIQDTGGAKATATVGTVVFTAVSYGSIENNISVQTTTSGVAAGSEVVTVTGTYPNYAIVVDGHASSSIAQVQAAIAANATAASVITADSLTTFAAGAAADLAGGTDVKTVGTEGIALESAAAADAVVKMMRLN